MKKKDRLLRTALLAVAMGAVLTACGGGGGSLPDRYELGEDHLPSVNKLASVSDGLSCEAETNPDDGSGAVEPADSGGTQAVSYAYAGAEDAGALVGEYVSALEDGYGCRVMDREGADAQPPDFSAGAGEVVVGTDSQTEGSLFALDIRWEAEGFTVTPLAFSSPGPEEGELITVEEAAALVLSLPPARLGLAGESMEDCSAVPEEGVVKVDGALCFTVNVYTRADHQIAGTCLVSADGGQIYRLDRETGAVVRIS